MPGAGSLMSIEWCYEVDNVHYYQSGILEVNAHKYQFNIDYSNLMNNGDNESQLLITIVYLCCLSRRSFLNDHIWGGESFEIIFKKYR